MIRQWKTTKIIIKELIVMMPTKLFSMISTVVSAAGRNLVQIKPACWVRSPKACVLGPPHGKSVRYHTQTRDISQSGTDACEHALIFWTQELN